MSSRLSWMARVEAYLATYYRPTDALLWFLEGL